MDLAISDAAIDYVRNKGGVIAVDYIPAVG